VRTLNTIAQALRKQRFVNGALRLDSTRLSFSLDPQGLPVGFQPYTHLQANQLIEEFMLLANMQVGA
jgi:exoribonuclease R